MPYVDLDTIQRPTAGSTVPVAQWGAQVNDNFAAINATLLVWGETFNYTGSVWGSTIGLYTTGHVLAEGNVMALDDVHADGYVKAGVNNPLWRLQRFGGTLDGSGNAAVAHNIFNGAQRVVMAAAVWKGNTGEAVKASSWTVDGTDFRITGGTGSGSRAWRGAIIYTFDSVAW